MLTQSEFIKQYTKGNHETEKKLNKRGHFAMPCDCGECQGWAMTNRSDLFHHLALSMKHENGQEWVEFIKFN